MKRVFSAWGKSGALQPHTFVAGDEPPKFADGTLMPDCENMFFRVDAANWEEAMAIYHLRLGREPYKPGVPAENCPSCGALFYARGSGQCWHCDYAC